ncbi:MAG: Fic/DOC family N-terminal domain-containing protein [Smithella sp.]
MEPYIPTSLPIDMTSWNWQELAQKISLANRKLAYFDGILSSIVNPTLFLSPLETKEAVLSSKIEGTITTIDEVLKFEANIKPESIRKQQDIQEVLNYRSAMRSAINWIEREMPFNVNLICNIQKELMTGVRGSNKQPGQIRKEQNWIGRQGTPIEQATYIPPEPLGLNDHLNNLIKYIDRTDQEAIIQTAILHAQFELLHPFLDGNGRTGRILIPLFLWQKKMIKAPVFYISEYLEANSDSYYDNLKLISQKGDWENWVNFFLQAVARQADQNSLKANQVLSLYQQMKTRIANISNSPHVIKILDTIFAFPILESTNFIKMTNLNRQTGNRIINRLKDEKILFTLREAAGRTPETLIFKDLMNIL